LGKPEVCDVCKKPGVTPWQVAQGDRKNKLMLCLIHSDPLRMLLNLTPDSAKRYRNPGKQALTRMHITAPKTVTPLDWMPSTP
jgi:hypothetical protein